MALQALNSSTSFANTMDEYLARCLVLLARGHRLPPPPQDLHLYPICGKGFSSHQALGGHKSSHRKPGVRPLSSSVSSNGSGVSSAELGRLGVYECNVCHRAFLTGQALVGHKRKHYLEGGSSSSSVGLRDFDLNLPALGELGRWMDDEDEVQSPLPMKKRRIYLEPL